MKGEKGQKDGQGSEGKNKGRGERKEGRRDEEMEGKTERGEKRRKEDRGNEGKIEGKGSTNVAQSFRGFETRAIEQHTAGHSHTRRCTLPPTASASRCTDLVDVCRREGLTNKSTFTRLSRQISHVHKFDAQGNVSPKCCCRGS